jgi:hypothetical protein
MVDRKELGLWLILAPKCIMDLNILFLCFKDFDSFFSAKEENIIYSFLGLAPPPGSKVSLHHGWSSTGYNNRR